MTELREPTEEERRGAKFVVDHLAACGDDTEKKIRFIAMLAVHQNDELATHRAITRMYEERRHRRKVSRHTRESKP